ncbi:MAG: S1 RNA-binding domain-containing protein [Candidatus Micrarchaeaceae archaeon]
MIIRKQLPSVGEVVLIKINKVMPFGAYCYLTEYSIDAYLPISEVSAGWIKNIHEFIKEGQNDVAKVSFVDPEKSAIDISLKKVSTKEKKDKLNEYSLEKRAEQLFKQAVATTGNEKNIAEIINAAGTKFKTYTELLDAAYSDDPGVSKALSSELAEKLHEIAQKNIKPKVYGVTYTLELRAKNKIGNIEKLRNALGAIEKLGIKVIYAGAPHYVLKAEGDTYPSAEAKIKNADALLAKHNELEFSLVKMG